jgi:hypothetical protein
VLEVIKIISEEVVPGSGRCQQQSSEMAILHQNMIILRSKTFDVIKEGQGHLLG